MNIFIGFIFCLTALLSIISNGLIIFVFYILYYGLKSYIVSITPTDKDYTFPTGYYAMPIHADTNTVTFFAFKTPFKILFTTSKFIVSYNEQKTNDDS